MTPANTKEMTMAEALRDAMRLALQEDSRVFLLGEDIGIKDGFGGGFTVTLGLSDEFGHERVMDTPLSEAAIIGAAVGAAMVGMRPVSEMQYRDFVFVGMDQVVNQAAKMHYMSNGTGQCAAGVKAACWCYRAGCSTCPIDRSILDAHTRIKGRLSFQSI